MEYDNVLHQTLRETDSSLNGVICGSYRRLKATSNDIDMLIVHPLIKTKKDLENSKNNYLYLGHDYPKYNIKEDASGGATGAGAIATSMGGGAGFGQSIFYRRIPKKKSRKT